MQPIDKVAIVRVSAADIGEAVARRYLAEAAKMLVVDIKSQESFARIQTTGIIVGGNVRSHHHALYADVNGNDGDDPTVMSFMSVGIPGDIVVTKHGGGKRGKVRYYRREWVASRESRAVNTE